MEDIFPRLSIVTHFVMLTRDVISRLASRMVTDSRRDSKRCNQLKLKGPGRISDSTSAHSSTHSKRRHANNAGKMVEEETPSGIDHSVAEVRDLAAWSRTLGSPFWGCGMLVFDAARWQNFWQGLV
jgi:hypothetical protein